MTGLSLDSVEVTITVDELLLWEGSPIPTGYSSPGIVDGLVRALAEKNIAEVYGFPHTAPLEADPALREPLERWLEAGHHLGNHTHLHAALNWVDADTYCRDIDTAEEHIGDLIARAPHRYFRYAMDMSGPSEARRGKVEDHLHASGYTNAPISAWFRDFAWLAPHYRAIETADDEALHTLRTSFVQAAVFQLQAHAQAARTMFGRDIPYIWLTHASPIAQDCLPAIIDAFTALGVRFVSLPHALSDVAYQAMPPVRREFRNHLQRLAIACGVGMAQIPQEMADAVLNAAPVPGMESIPAYDAILRSICERAGGTYDWDWTTV